MHFQLYFIVIIKLLCKLEANLKQNNQRSPHIRKPQDGGPKARTPSVHPIFQSLSEIDYPKKKTGEQQKQKGFCSQSTFMVLHHNEDPGCFNLSPQA